MGASLSVAAGAIVVVPFPPGGGTDILARMMGQWLSERLGQPFVIENRPGAGSNIGTEAVVKAPSDGYTLLLAVSPNAINATLYENLNFDFIRDIAPIAGLIRVPNVMVVHPSVPAKTVSRVHRPCQSQPRQDQRGLERHRDHAAHRRRAVQD